MSCDVAIVGSPFLDLVFEGLPAVPGPGEEHVARSFRMVPGGTGMQAIAAARLGLETALVAPFGDDEAAALLRRMLEAEGVRVTPSTGPGSGLPVTALLSTPEGVAMASALGGEEPTAADVAETEPAAVIASLGRVDLAPPSSRLYAVTGALELEHVAADLDRRLEGVHVLILNRDEAGALTGEDDAGRAALKLSSPGRTAVVTLAAEGAVAARGEDTVRARVPRVELVEATGAGDVFAAAFLWAERRGLDLAESLAWGCLYASLSVAAPTTFDGAPSMSAFLEAAAAHGLTLSGG